MEYVAANGVIGAAVGGVTGAAGGAVFGKPGHKGLAALAGFVGGGVGGGVGGVGSSISSDFFGPFSAFGDFASGYGPVKLTFSITDAMDPCASTVSPTRQRLRDSLAFMTGAVAALPLSDTGDSIVIGVSTGFVTSAVDWAASVVE
jgi:hypothetical protein